MQYAQNRQQGYLSQDSAISADDNNELDLDALSLIDSLRRFSDIKSDIQPFLIKDGVKIIL